eukprot:CAMPEP_0183728364 /NCGR_PEP_ID=MMETSP0737-20130205/27859_1 /TAXON_ID=385413 /ORGANISM="Thalassiosira miniscula, Strain CCMP1093" /LENGTH=55 /DNA_ID=CAMNT_0025960283 /DNA_START=764 /DNA_END=931 /DNA_ORIENTATION=+
MTNEFPEGADSFADEMQTQNVHEGIEEKEDKYFNDLEEETDGILDGDVEIGLYGL